MAALQHSPFQTAINPNFASTPPGLAQAPAQAQTRDGAHQRTYQACIPCRKRKVRCDLGSVDSPHDPPCQRCRRESKECYFSATRRKKKGDIDAADDEEQPEEYTIKAGRKRSRAVETEEPTSRPRTPGGSVGQTQPLRRPHAARPPDYDEEDIKTSEQTTALLQEQEVFGGHDALRVLMQAAGIGGRTNSMTGTSRPNLNGPSPSSLPDATSPITEKNSFNHRASIGKASSQSSPSDIQIQMDSPFYKPALKAWSRFRFVRSGWFTAKEGIAYVAYFYRYLSPLTPITLPDFSGLETHEQLLTQEPMLAITILLISSRHMRLEGVGNVTRPFNIHQTLWQHLKGMIDRVIWGQEQFGGGFCGAGSQPGCDVDPLTRKGLRTLGTVESFMLLTEWHPRAMHFPPDEADDELMAATSPIATPDPESGSLGIGGHRMDSWLEPCWRSDRMCWMLLGMAMSLAFEIGVFDKSEWQRHAYTVNGQPMSAPELAVYDKRRGNVRDLLLVHVTLTSGRLGLTSMLPSNYSKPEDSELYKMQPGEHATIQETVLQFWLRIAAILRDGNKRIFANKTFTRDLIKNGSYKAALEQFREPMAAWRRDFEQSAVIPKYMRYMLGIEFEYSRVYLNALSLQAVAERCANEFPQVNESPMDLSRSNINNGGRTDVAIAPQTLHRWLGGDRVYMNEVRDAACNLLTIVTDGLCPGGYLRHAPVRSYFRIISVAIMLLKSFSLGASEADVSDSLKLLDRTVSALRTCIVDDVHVASRFADLLDVLIQNLKPRLVRISADGRDIRSRKQSVRSTPVSGQDIAMTNGTSGVSQQNYSNNNNQQAQWPYAANHPMHGIPNETYDLIGSHEFSVMPPPSFLQTTTAPASTSGIDNTANSHYPASTYANSNAHSFEYNNSSQPWEGVNDDQYWLALPLDNLLSLQGADVNQTMYGPEVGGNDMLELLLAGNGSSYQ